jgi:hypothetical protein
MGAIFKPDLRSDVTHLIVGNVNTPKYLVLSVVVASDVQYASQNRFDLKIMDVSWVNAAYDKWIQGEDVDFEEVCLLIATCSQIECKRTFASSSIRPPRLLDQCGISYAFPLLLLTIRGRAEVDRNASSD